MKDSILETWVDLTLCYEKSYLAFMLGWQDVKQRYRRSKLGPFWLTLSMGIVIATIGLVFGQVFNSPMSEYLPFLATGIIVWNFLSATISEGCQSFVESSSMIRQLSLPLSMYPLRVLWRNLIIFGHNIIILPLVFLVVGKGINCNILLLIPGLVIFILNLFWMQILFGTICTRFRDMPQIVNSLIQVLFYITPVIWMPNSLNPRSAALLMDPNPLYHLLEVLRAPILGAAPTVLNYVVSVLIFFVGSAITFLFYGKYKKRIAYWL